MEVRMEDVRIFQPQHLLVSYHHAGFTWNADG